jgi:hypothetical protein
MIAFRDNKANKEDSLILHGSLPKLSTLRATTVCYKNDTWSINRSVQGVYKECIAKVVPKLNYGQAIRDKK